MQILSGRLYIILVVVLILTACQGDDDPVEVISGEIPTLAEIAEAELSNTLQADAALTAEWIATFQPNQATPTEEPLPTAIPVEVEGVPPVQRVGACEQPEDYALHVREGFCISTPADWLIHNIDGGMAASLMSTPGQAIAIQPDWVDSTEACGILIYIAAERSSTDHLDTRFRIFATRSDLTALSGVRPYSLGGMAISGFTWETTVGGGGGIYAAILDVNRLLHISQGGTDCTFDDLLPIFETFRVIPPQ